MRGALAFVLACLSLPLEAQTLDADLAALARLEATTAQDPAALTAVLAEYENVLSSLRAHARALDTARRENAQDLAEEAAELTDLMQAWSLMGRTGPVLALHHPDGPVAAARAALILGRLKESAEARTTELSHQAATLSDMTKDAAQAETALRKGLIRLQETRTALLATTPAKDLRGDQTLTIDLDALRALSQRFGANDASADLPDGAGLGNWGGDMTWPVEGSIDTAFGEVDPAGQQQDGTTLETHGRALVRSPSRASVRFADVIGEMGGVILLEPRQGYMVILSGLDVVLVEAGTIVRQGDGLGLMRAQNESVSADHADFPQALPWGAGETGSDRLYIEIRENGTPVDPAIWFAQRG